MINVGDGYGTERWTSAGTGDGFCALNASSWKERSIGLGEAGTAGPMASAADAFRTRLRAHMAKSLRFFSCSFAIRIMMNLTRNSDHRATTSGSGRVQR
ncbi:hypothetical protein CHELA20_51488 [Hyphomicrobiales bacterium]|nr:hypothetical protein CHELA41_23528 [Hyphomicrobiales bacterium]CAH1676412.1 hypothetical protein CHELA20_51488 [Hyphomicrobiales bacterium]